MQTEEIKRWLKSFGIGLIVFGLASIYLYLRRGQYGLSNVNKALAYAAVTLAGLTLLIRPLMTYIKSLASMMTIRRQLGLIAFVAALSHVIISLFFIPRFTFDWYKNEWVAIAFGIVAIFTWMYLTYISRNSEITKLGSTKWRVYQSWGGKIAYLFVYFHLIHLEYSDWSLWVTGQLEPASYLKNPTFVPESFILFVFMTMIILYRIFHDLSFATREPQNEVQAST